MLAASLRVVSAVAGSRVWGGAGLGVGVSSPVALVGVELRSWGWVVGPLPGVYGVGGGCAPTGFTRWRGIALLGLGVSVSPLVALVGVGLRSWGWVVGPLPWDWGRGWLQYALISLVHK